MAVINPFFGQGVKQPTFRGGALQDTSAPNEMMKLKNALVQEQTAAFFEGGNAMVAILEAEAKIKEEERSLILKKSIPDLMQMSNTITEGYKGNKKFNIGTSTVVDPGVKGFHSYDNFEFNKVRLTNEAIDELQSKFNPEGDERLNELIEIETKGRLSNAFHESNGYILTNIQNEALAEIEEVGIQSLTSLVATGDWGTVSGVDELVDQKISQGTLSVSKGFQFKQKWRRNAWQTLSYNLTKPNSTNDDKRKYLELFDKAIYFKQRQHEKGQPKEQDFSSVGEWESFKIADKASTPEEQFFSQLPINDILNINQSIGAVALVPEKSTQSFMLRDEFLQKPTQAMETYGYEIKFDYNDKGKPTGYNLVPSYDNFITEKVTLSPGQGLSSLGSKDDLMKWASTDEERTQIENHFKNHKQYPWDINKGVAIKKEPSPEEMHNFVRKQLDERGLNFIKAEEVTKYANSYAKAKLKRSREDYKEAEFATIKPLLHGSYSKFMEDWNLMYNVDGSTGFAVRQPHVQAPLLPWEDDQSESFLSWKTVSPHVDGLKRQITAVNSIFAKADSTLREIEAGQYDSIQTVEKLVNLRKEMNYRASTLPDSDITSRIPGLRTGVKKQVSSWLNANISKHYSIVTNNSDTGQNIFDLIKNRNPDLKKQSWNIIDPNDPDRKKTTFNYKLLEEVVSKGWDNSQVGDNE